VAELREAAAALIRTPKVPKQRAWWWRWMTPKRVALALVVDLVLGSVAWHYLTESHPTAIATAVERTANDAAHNNWTGVYESLCSSDRQQITEANLEDAGQEAMLQLGELNHITVATVTPLSIPVGPLHWPAAQVSGQLVPVIGAPSAYTVTVVRALAGWQICFSAGGYSSAALGVSAPLGSATLG
jgi:hypothetical protein